MSIKFKRLMVFPIAIVLISCYLIGFRIYQNRTEEVSPPETVVVTETQGEEDAPLEKININTATKEELMTIHGVGKVIAERIITQRESVGEYMYIEELMSIKGIGESMFRQIEKYITVE